MFVSDQLNEQGVIAVKMYKNGIYHEVVIDDYFPCKDGKPIYSQAYRNHICWVTILEKAWAKLHGSYHRINAGLPMNVFRDLTGAPAF